MSNQKWDLTDAAIKRIAARLAELKDGEKEWYGDPVKLLLEAMKPENYANPHRTAEELIQTWIALGQQKWLCTSFFKAYATDRSEAREATRNFLTGLEQMQGLGLDV
jgi:hypothetical protein